MTTYHLRGTDGTEVFTGTIQPPPGGGSQTGDAIGAPATGDVTGSSLATAQPTLATPPDSHYFWGGDAGASDWYGFLPVAAPTIVTGLQINIANSSSRASGKHVRLALYSADASFQPVALLGQTAALSVDSVAEGDWLSGSFAAAVLLEPGNYLVCGSSDDGGAQAWYPNVVNVGPVYWPDGQTDVVLSAIFRDRGYGVFPSTLAAWTDGEVDTGDGATTVPAALVTRAAVVVAAPRFGDNIVVGPETALELQAVAGQTKALSVLRQADDTPYLTKWFNDTFDAANPVVTAYIDNEGILHYQATFALVTSGGCEIDTRGVADGMTEYTAIVVGTDAPGNVTAQIDLMRLSSRWFVLRATDGFNQDIPDALLGAGDLRINFDSTNATPKLKFKGKKQDGTVVNFTLNPD